MKLLPSSALNWNTGRQDVLDLLGRTGLSPTITPSALRLEWTNSARSIPVPAAISSTTGPAAHTTPTNKYAMIRAGRDGTAESIAGEIAAPRAEIRPFKNVFLLQLPSDKTKPAIWYMKRPPRFTHYLEERCPMPTVPGFIASVNGFHFQNDYSSGTPDITIPTPFGPVGLGDASNGLCGGFVFAVTDFFIAGLPPLQNLTKPSGGSPLFDYIVTRLLDSFNGPGLIAKYYSWMARPSHNTLLWGPGTTQLTIDSWPSIKGLLDAGSLVPLACIIPQSASPFDLGANHQVIAYGYDFNADSTVTIRVYDPNTSPADADDVRITFNPTDHTVPLSDNISVDSAVRGVFPVPYSFKNPAALEPPTLFLSNAWFVSMNVSGPFSTGEPTHVTVSMKNIGTTVWTPGGATPFRLGSQNPQDNNTWGLDRVDLPFPVVPGQQVTFAFNVTSPALQGVFDFQWQMVQDGVTFFGQPTLDAQIAVQSSSHVLLRLTLQPAVQPVGVPFQLLVTATDPNTGAAVSAEVLLDGVVKGVTGTPVPALIPIDTVTIPGGKPPIHRFAVPPLGIVRAQNFEDTDIKWNPRQVAAPLSRAAGA